MRKTDAERRALLKTLKPRLVEIADRAAVRSGPVDPVDVGARVASARAELQEERSLPAAR